MKLLVKHFFPDQKYPHRHNLYEEPIRAQNLVPNESNKAPIVGGILMGKLSARSIDIRDTFEVPLGIVDGDIITSINTEYLHNKAEHLTQVSDNEVWISSWTIQ